MDKNQNSRPKDDPVGDCNPLVRGLNFEDKKMPVGLKMSVPLARWLIAVLSEGKARVAGSLFVSCLEQAIAVDKGTRCIPPDEEN